MGTPKWKRDFLGRWSAQGTTDKYVRTAFRVVESIQVRVARLGRRSMRGGPDFFGEEQALTQLSEFLFTKGLEREVSEEKTDARGVTRPPLSRPALSRRGLGGEDGRSRWYSATT